MNSNYVLKLIAFAMVGLSFSAYSDDDKKEEKPKNQFTVDGAATPITSAAFIYDEDASISDVDGNPYYRHELALLPVTITIQGTLAKGTGNMIDLMINGSTIELAPGTYVFTGEEENAKALEVWAAYLEMNFNSTTNTRDESLFTSGELVISKSGETYTIDFEGTAGGKAVIAHYVGVLTSISGD
jgi:hypothetical protein